MQDNYDNHPLDLSYLSEMVGHDPVFMIEIFDTFINQTPFYIAELEDALSNENWVKVANCAHKIKPTFTYIGRNDVRDMVQSIEQNARDENTTDKISILVNDLKVILQKIYLQLEEAKVQLLHKDLN